MKLLANSQHADSVMSEVLVQEILWILGQVRGVNKRNRRTKALGSFSLSRNCRHETSNEFAENCFDSS